ncbi:hypothetical protein SAMN05444000_1486 [Shimia gijangensis]|uniref:Uncharacterized protein n=1 Tax=Shimia gijangensis TaxID=1470563 RepID=A0A1M6TZL3_9RHOB|nr:hypothetical protein [Shimia gijangensis]SHK62472.1 hypothetical protein SAMN05444000_1486 [Shimia gijangensis]
MVFDMTEDQLAILRFFLEGDWLVFKIMIGVAVGLILADYYIKIGDKEKGMSFLDVVFVTIFVPVVLLTLTWPVAKLLVLPMIGVSLGQ